MKTPTIRGLVLSGGKSTRMGTDKSVLDYHGQPQVQFMIDVLSKFCNSVFISGRKESVSVEGADYILDQFDIAGPMNGILSALAWEPGCAWLIVAVDMPNVNAQVIELLISQREPAKLATCFFNKAENFPEPLLTIWEPSALPKLNLFVGAGEISPKKFLQQNDVKYVDIDDLSILLNINSPDEYRKFKSNFSKG